MVENQTGSRTALVVGASRTIGLGLAAELVRRGWTVIATARDAHPAELLQLAARSGGRLTVERLDITDREQTAGLRGRLAGTVLDLLYVSAGITDEDRPVGEVSTRVFVDVMVTNALSPMQVVEDLASLVSPHGTIAVMSSRQGSIGFNTRGGHEVYRASKSALNQLMRSYAARTSGSARTLLLTHPGWVQTDLGGPGAQLSVEESTTGLIDTVERHAGDGGLQFLDYAGQVVPW